MSNTNHIDTELAIDGCETCPMRDGSTLCTHPSVGASVELPELVGDETPNWCPLRAKGLTLRLAKVSTEKQEQS